MSIADDFEHNSTLTIDADHRIRIMHMLMLHGHRRGKGKGKLSGFVMFAHDGKMYTVTTADIWCHDFHDFMQGVRNGEIPYVDDSTFGS